ncbi:MAG: homoserine O-succinyltransferase [Pseudomonadota bacterium]
MPIIAHSALPTFTRMQAEGIHVLAPHRAQRQQIRELHIGLLNMMPDEALQATERQFLRLIGESNPVAQFHVHPFSLPQIVRHAETQAYIDRYYDTFDHLRDEGLDALIITGANVQGTELSAQPFWQPLQTVLDWAADTVTSTLCSCLATHAVLQSRYQQKRQRQVRKTWGVYRHEVTDPTHPLTRQVNTRFDVPHSRWHVVTPEQFHAAGLPILVQSPEAGVHLATSPDGLRFVMFQGHPEYDAISLLKEYKREMQHFISGDSPDIPPLITHYFSRRSQAILTEYHHQVRQACRAGNAVPVFPESLLIPNLQNTWHDSAQVIMSNWVGLVYQLTHDSRQQPFMDGVDPQQPLDQL